MKPFTRIMRPYDGSAPGMPGVKHKRQPKAKASGGGKKQRRMDCLDMALSASRRVPDQTFDVPQIILPWPGPTLWANERIGKHWAESHKDKRRLVDATAAACVEAGLHRLTIAPGAITVRWISCPSADHLWDDDGLIFALKSARDTIARALGVDDSRFTAVVERGDKSRDGGVIVNIEVMRDA